MSGAPIYGSGPQRIADKSTRVWSDNAALVIGDYAAHPDGYGLGYDNVNWASIAREAKEAEVMRRLREGERTLEIYDF